MATDFVKALDDLVRASNADWRVFIRRLGPLHATWHTEHNGGQAKLGFLIFHWELIRRFVSIGGDHGLGGLAGIRPYAEAELASFGAPFNVASVAAHGDVTSLEHFSGDLEAWHNDAHMRIGMATGHNLMNPRTNVRLPQFWRLHYFINDQFEVQIATFAAAGTTAAQAIAQLETNVAAARQI